LFDLDGKYLNESMGLHKQNPLSIDYGTLFGEYV